MSTIKHVLRYWVRRNTRGALPVYSSQRLIQIRNVEGHVDSLVQDLKQSLFDEGSPHAQRLSVTARHQRHVILSGGRFKRNVLAWLTARGF